MKPFEIRLNAANRVMKHAEHLILIGYRATGKTTIAKRLGERLGIPAWDSDREVERTAGKSIAEIFAEEGESAFRKREAEAVRTILHREATGPIVLATGGGAILHAETRRLLKEKGYVVWLTATPETILHRMRGDAASETMRPSLTGLPPKEEIVSLLEKRHAFYAETAHQIVETDRTSIEEIVRLLLPGGGEKRRGSTDGT